MHDQIQLLAGTFLKKNSSGNDLSGSYVSTDLETSRSLHLLAAVSDSLKALTA